jgi:hypothetical protein
LPGSAGLGEARCGKQIDGATTPVARGRHGCCRHPVVAAVRQRERSESGIEVLNGSTRLQAGVWFLDADIEYRLNEAVLEAIQSGLVLDIELTIRLTQRRRIIWDPLVRRTQAALHSCSSMRSPSATSSAT